MLVDAFSRIPYSVTKGKKLVIVGGAPYADEFIQSVHRGADPRVVFPGYVFGRGYWELQKHSYLSVVPTEVGGTHPVILEAMAAGTAVLVNDHAPNVETIGIAGTTFSGSEGAPALARELEALLLDPARVERLRDASRERAKAYSWDNVTTQYEDLLHRVVAGRSHGPLDPRLVVSDAPAPELTRLAP
jgi:glycosyltransferase involved in cell wall biosynthesis